MKKLVFILSLLSVLGTTAQEYDNLGQMLRVHNVIMGKGIIKGDLGLGLAQIKYKPIDAALIDFTRITTNVGLDINPVQHFHIRTQFFIDLLENKQTPPWLSNMYYQIGWYDWRNKRVSFGYENYGANRFSGGTDWGENFMRGSFFTSFNLDLLGDYSPLKIDETSQIRITPIVRYAIEYSDKFGVEKGGNNKIVLGTSTRWSIAKKFYVEGALLYYLNKETKLPWDPDFTYGFGYFNWKAFNVNVSYGNWIANRFSSKEKEMEHGFLNGEFKVSFNWAL